jgi:hypothetical protein
VEEHSRELLLPSLLLLLLLVLEVLKGEVVLAKWWMVGVTTLVFV